MLNSWQKKFIKHSDWLWLIAILVIVTIIRFQTLSIPLDRDEGEYAYIAQVMRQGGSPYLDVYSMKWPGIYFFYTAIFQCLGETVRAIHIGLALINIATIIFIFLIAKKIKDSSLALIASAFFATLTLNFDMDGFRANAEHFVVLPALAGILALLYALESKKPKLFFLSGILIGISVFTKQHAVFFAAFSIIYLFIHSPRPFGQSVKSLTLIIIGMLLPILLSIIFLWYKGALQSFYFQTLVYAQEYTKQIPLKNAGVAFLTATSHLWTKLWPILLFIPIGFISLLIKTNKKLRAILLLLFFLSFLAVCPGFYFRGHYFLLLAPAASIVAALGFWQLIKLTENVSPRWISKTIMTALTIFICFFVFQREYGNPFSFKMLRVSNTAYKNDPYRQIAHYIQTQTSADDKIMVLGSEPQVYFYANRRAASGYIYMYPLMERHPFASEMQKSMINEIIANQPKVLVFSHISLSWNVFEGSDRLIFRWMDLYSRNFELVGMVDIKSLNEIRSAWGQAAASFSPQSSQWVSIYKRK